MRLEIRDARPDDTATLIGFLADLQDAERAVHPSRLPGAEIAASCLDRLADKQAQVLIAEVAGRPVGLVAGWVAVDEDMLQTPDWRHHGWISDLYVVPERRGERVAGRLLSAIADRLKRLGARRLRICSLSCNDAALAAYRRFGFRPFETTLDMALPD